MVNINVSANCSCGVYLHAFETEVDYYDDLVMTVEPHCCLGDNAVNFIIRALKMVADDDNYSGLSPKTKAIVNDAIDVYEEVDNYGQ
jgi:hypothetical protein